jgi:hypothetical protein
MEIKIEDWKIERLIKQNCSFERVKSLSVASRYVINFRLTIRIQSDPVALAVQNFCIISYILINEIAGDHNIP